MRQYIGTLGASDDHLSRSIQDLTPQERAYLEALTKGLIHRVGSHAAGKHLDRLTMADLPTN